MSDAKELVVKLRADASGYDKGTKQAQKDNDDLKKSTGGLGSVLSGGVGKMLGFAGSIATGLGIASLASAGMDVLKDATIGTISAAADSQTVMAQTNAVLASTHGVSGQTAQSISDLAGKLQLLTGVDDEAVQGAENMLATFTNIKGSVFPQTTQAVLDMATAMNGGAVPSAEQLRQTAIQVGKALNDPIQGVTALQRVGVKLSATQLDQVKHFMAVGDTAKAQGVILGELSKEFGGAADAAGGTFAGKLATLQGVLGNVQEAIGGALLPVLTNLMSAVAPLIQSFASALPGALQTVSNLFQPVADAAENVWEVFQNGLRPAMDTLSSAFSNIQGPGDGIHDLIVNLSVGLGKIAPIFYQLGQTVGTVAVTAFKNLQPLLGNLGNIFTQLAPIIGNLAAQVLPLAVQMFGMIGGFIAGTVLPILSQLAGFLSATVVPIIGMLGTFLGNLFNVLSTSVFPAVQNLANVFMTQLLPPLQNIIGRILPVLNGLFQVLGFILGNVIGPIISGVIAPILGFLFTVLGKILDAVGWVLDKLGAFKDTLMTALQPAIKNVNTVLGQLHSWFNDKILPVITAVHAFFNDHILPVLQQVGTFIKDKIVSNLQTMWGFIQSNVLPILSQLGGYLKTGIGNEFKIFGDVIQTVFGHIGDLMGNIGKLKDKFGDLLGKLGELKDKFTSIKFQFPHIDLPHFSIVGNFSVNPPSVPHLDIKWYAKGGVFTSPTIAGVGDVPEAVIPLDRLGGMVGGRGNSGNGAGSNGGSGDTHIQLDGRTIVRAFMPYLVEELRRSGAIRSI